MTVARVAKTRMVPGTMTNVPGTIFVLGDPSLLAPA
jgi:hypothetical protein